MKKASILCLAMLLCLACTGAYAETEGLYTYQVNRDNTATITKFDWARNRGDIYIPEMLGGHIVTAIGERAFAVKDNNTVENRNQKAESQAVKITLPDSIVSIGEQAFRGVAITYINIPLNTVEIGGGAFAQCTVSRFNVPKEHQVFATLENALYNKQTRTLIAWPENKEISEIPNGIVSIGDYAFYGRSFKDYQRKNPYTLPDTIMVIGKYAFAGVIGGYVYINVANTSIIDDYAFYKTKVEFTTSLSLSRIGKHAFEESKLTVFDRVLSNTPYEIDDYAFYNCWLSTNYLQLNGAVSIGAHAFKKNQYSVELRLDEEDLSSLSSLGEGALHSVKVGQWGNNTKGYHAYANLTNNQLQSIPKLAFSNTYITDLTVGPSVTYIDDNAFSDCKDLSVVKLSEGLQTIGNEVFKGCKSLADIYVPASVTMIGNAVFDGCADTFVVTVEAGSYGEVWARTCGYAYVINGEEEDTSWLLGDVFLQTDSSQDIFSGADSFDVGQTPTPTLNAVTSTQSSVSQDTPSASTTPPTYDKNQELPAYQTGTFQASNDVYTGPGTDYYRRNNGIYNSGGSARIYGKDGEWLLIGYQLGNGDYRIGYIRDYTLPAKLDSSQVRPLSYAWIETRITEESVVTDDPVINMRPLENLSPGTPVTFLAWASDKHRWALIEYQSPSLGKVRAFVKGSNLGLMK